MVVKHDISQFTKPQLREEVEALYEEVDGLLAQVDASNIHLSTQRSLAGEFKKEAETFLHQKQKAENREIKIIKAWDKLMEILDDNDALGRINGWYWHIHKKQPVYVDDVSIDGMTGYAINLGPDGRFIGSVTDTFQYNHLIRIDRNLDNPF